MYYRLKNNIALGPKYFTFKNSLYIDVTICYRVYDKEEIDTAGLQYHIRAGFHNIIDLSSYLITYNMRPHHICDNVYTRPLLDFEICIFYINIFPMSYISFILLLFKLRYAATFYSEKIHNNFTNLK